MRRLRLLPLVAVVAVVAVLWGLWRHPTTRALWSAARVRLAGWSLGASRSPSQLRPPLPARIFYLKTEPGGQGVWTVNPDGSNGRRLGGPLSDPVISWTGAGDFALLVDAQGKAWLTAGGEVRPLDTGDLRPDSLRVPAQPVGSAAYLYGLSKDGGRPVLLRVRPDGQREAYRGTAPLAWSNGRDPGQFIMVLSKPGTWEAVALRYDAGPGVEGAGVKVHSIEGNGTVEKVEYGSSGDLLVIHAGGGRYLIDARQWSVAGTTDAWVAPVGNNALILSPTRTGPVAAVAPPDHLGDLAPWPDLSRDVQAIGNNGAAWVLDESRDTFLLATALSPTAASRELYAAFLRDQTVVPLGSFPTKGFFGFTGEGFALGGIASDNGELQSVRMIQPTGALPLWDRVRITGWWRRVYGVVVQTERAGQSEVGLITRNGYDRLFQGQGKLVVLAGEGPAVLVAGRDAQGHDNLRLVDPLTREVTLLDSDPATALLWGE